jgi:Leucine-rich repeat (LRR) protein
MLKDYFKVESNLKGVIGLLLSLLVGCDTRTADTTAKDIRPLSLQKNNHLVVATSDYHSGALVEISLAENRIETLPVSIFSDAIVRNLSSSPFFFVVNRLGGDNIEWGGRRDKKVYGQFSVGRQTNPQDISVIDLNAAYVSRLASAKLLKVNPSSGLVLKEIDLFVNADFKTFESTDPDGYPEMSWMVRWNQKLIIALQRLNSDEGYIPSDKSQLAVLNLENDTVEKIITLMSTNPVTELKIVKDKLSVGEAGKLNVLDGGVELFDSNLRSLGMVTTERQLGGDIIDCALLNDSLGVAIIAKSIYGPNRKTQLVVFKLSDGEVVSVPMDPGNYSLHQVVVDYERHLFYVADRDPKQPGIWVYDIKTLQPMFKTKFDVGLPPYHMELTD